jgi:hypothetical protein
MLFLQIAHNSHASESGTNVLIGEGCERQFRSEQAG